MARTFVFGIGGTGSRVLRSLSMLLASGVQIGQEAIVPIMIDLDTQNADTVRTHKAMQLYSDIRKMAYDRAPSEGFFKTSLTTLAALNHENQGRIKDSFQLEFGDINRTFANYLDFGALSDTNRALMHSLFDSSYDNARTELHLNLSVGFKGNPNIGSIVFNHLVETPEYKFFENMFQQGDRIFVISSIFGGTGSSGFPILVKNLRRSKNNYLKDAAIGAVVVMPYFAVEQKHDSAIDSRMFISKTKAALAYYAQELDEMDAVYYIYDKPGNPYQNNEGGAGQKNDAHLVEMIAATAMIHFSNQSDPQKNSPGFYEFGIRGETSEIDAGHFFEATQQQLLVPLTRLKIMAKLMRDHVPQNTQAAFAKSMQLGSRLSGNDPFLQNLNNFVNHHFMEWLKELGRNYRSFKPFHLDTSFDRLVNGRELKGGLTSREVLSTNYFNTMLNKMESKLAESHQNVDHRLMQLLYQASERTFKEKIERLPQH